MWMWSVEAAKSESNKAKKYFRMEFVDKEQEDTCKDLDFGALETDLQANRKLLGCLQLQLPDAASGASSFFNFFTAKILRAINSSGAVKDHTFWAPTASVHVQFTTCVRH
ncbi:hypothetical protein Goarm_008696 [Gossypium armourianum]|uniref:Uncharacterized protein n=1 Tax=Gossypium armourianum TaxID=34283 RepID=A0A7J9JQS5_9ROSI|nr:hypothetical protein [Gossypium armourianum]